MVYADVFPEALPVTLAFSQRCYCLYGWRNGGSFSSLAAVLGLKIIQIPQCSLPSQKKTFLSFSLCSSSDIYSKECLFKISVAVSAEYPANIIRKAINIERSFLYAPNLLFIHKSNKSLNGKVVLKKQK